MDDFQIVLKKHKQAQLIAKKVMMYLHMFIKPGMTEKEIREEAEIMLKKYGSGKFWYYGVGALVFVGNRTSIAISGDVYEPSHKKVEENDIITVDLGPTVDDIFWGDYACTFVVIDGVVCDDNGFDLNRNTFKYASGIDFVNNLHILLQRIALPDKTFHEIHRVMNSAIKDAGYVNRDHRRNLGHTIERSLEERRYIEKRNPLTLKKAGLFTFEPFVVKKYTKAGRGIGFKHERVYYWDFERGKLERLDIF